MSDKDKSGFLGLILPQEVKDKLEGEKIEAENKKDIADYKFEKFKLWLNLAKWFIGSVAITLVVFFFNWSLSERGQGIAEIKQYEQHVAMITDDGSIEKRRLLAQFFSKVTASSTLKKGWIAYAETVDKEYKEYKEKITPLEVQKVEVEEKIEEAKAINFKPTNANSGPPPITVNITELLEKKAEIVKKQSQIKAEYSLRTDMPKTIKSSEVIIYFQITDESLRSYSTEAIAKLRRLNYNAFGTELVNLPKFTTNEIRYFKDSDLPLAVKLREDLIKIGLNSEIKDITGLGSNVKSGTLEVWIAQKPAADKKIKFFQKSM